MNKKLLKYLIVIFTYFIFFLHSAFALQSNWSGVEEAKVRLISPISKIGQNSLLHIGLEYQLQEGWKTYWYAPGEGGFPQELDWSRSTNISSLDILWPIPEEFEILGIKSIGYTDEVIFPLKIDIEDVNKPLVLIIDVNYLTCKDICIPGQAILKLDLPSGIGKVTEHSYKIEKYLSSLPVLNNTISGFEINQAKIFKEKKHFSIIIEATSILPFNNPKFFINTKFGLPIISPTYTYSANRKNVKAKYIFYENSINNEEFDLSVLLKDKDIAIHYKKKVKPEIKYGIFINNQSLLYIFIISFLGGLILNFMPCVLPVLSIKLLSILNNNKKSFFYSYKKSFFITASGIVTSFLIIALILIGLRFSGITISWGMQFQQPLFLMTISLVLFLFSINLLGFFELKLPHWMINSLSSSTDHKSAYSDFFNGFFATILATPCSAPFVGTAITAAFTQSSFVMTGVFFFMGLGMASPYLIIGLNPKSIVLLPKPGPWMIKLKYLLAMLLLGTLAWLATILQNYFNFYFIILSFCLYLIIIASYKYLNKNKAFAIVFSIFLFFSLAFLPQLKTNKIILNEGWQDLSIININNLIDSNQIIFVDITADWCATCQFNKLNVINSNKIKNVFTENNIMKVRGDWTKPNKRIEEYLHQNNRFGIPFNVMYNKKYAEGIILSEILTTKEITKTIELMKK